MRGPLIALSFLSIVPLPNVARGRDDMQSALKHFPLVGLLLGGIVYAIATGLRGHVTSLVLAVVLVACMGLFSGGLHLDGWADLFDGLGGARGDRQRALKIMRDPGIGALGAGALFTLLIAKTAAFAAWPATAPMGLWFVAPALSRALSVAALAWGSPRGAQGAGSAGLASFLSLQGKARIVTPVLALAYCVPAMVWTGPFVLWPCLLATASGALVLFFAWRLLGAVTGDVCGAVVEGTETAFLLAVGVFF